MEKNTREMTLFMNNLNSEGKPIIENVHCQKCGFTSQTEQGIRVHMAVHRDGTTTSYHTKDGLYKSERHTYET